MKLILFFILYILSGCSSVTENEDVQDKPKDKPQAVHIVTCEERFKSYSECMINFHKTRCDSLKKALEDKTVKKQLLDQANETCDMQSFLATCNLNDLNIHTMTIKATKERNKKIFTHCGLQPRPGF